MAERNRGRFDKPVWDNFPPFFLIFIVVLAAFVGVGFITKAVGIGLPPPAEKVDGGVLVPLLILAVWLCLLTASILVSLWKGGRRNQAGQPRPSGLDFPGGGAASQW